MNGSSVDKESSKISGLVRWFSPPAPQNFNLTNDAFFRDDGIADDSISSKSNEDWEPASLNEGDDSTDSGFHDGEMKTSFSNRFGDSMIDSGRISIRELEANEFYGNRLAGGNELPISRRIRLFYRASTIFLGILFWYFSSLSITTCNKLILETYDFPYPLLLTYMHFFLCSVLLILGFLYSRFFPPFPEVDFIFYSRFLLPISFLTVGDIAFSNLAYTLVPISGMTVIKSSIVFFTYILSLWFGIEKFRCSLFLTVVFTMLSVAFSVPAMAIKGILGPIYLMIAVLMSAARWVIIHTQLHKYNFKPLQLMILTQPMACMLVGIPAFGIDTKNLINISSESPVFRVHTIVAILIFLSCVFSFLLLLSEFRLVGLTSSLSLSIVGLGKEVLLIILSVAGFNERLKSRVIVGIICSISGIFIYSWMRYRNEYQENNKKTFELEELQT